MTFGSYLREQRQVHNLSVKKVADRLGFSGSYVSQLENGSRVPSLKQLPALAKAYKVPIDQIKGWWTETKIQRVSIESKYRFGSKEPHKKETIHKTDLAKAPIIKLPARNLDKALAATKEFYLFSKDAASAGRHIFGFRADGLSLPDAGILPGDLVIIDPDAEAAAGDIVVLQTPDGFAMSYYHKRSGYFELRPEVSGFKKAYPLAGCEIVGRLMYHIKKY